MRVVAALSLALVAATVAACDPTPPSGVDKAVLDEAVARAIGSPSTCVMVAENRGKLVYRYGGHTVCARSINACDAPGPTTVTVQLDAARMGTVRTASCDTADQASRGVAWASAPLPVLTGKADRKMAYAAFMESDNALSGREAKLRLEAAFAKVGF